MADPKLIGRLEESHLTSKEKRQVKKLLAIAIAVLVGVGMTTAVGHASAAKPKVLCYGKKITTPKPKTKPGFCRMSVNTNHPNLMSMFKFKARKWSKWSNKVAVGSGKIATQSHRYKPAMVRLSKPRKRCGRLMFTRAQIKSPGKAWNKPFPLLTCRP